MKFYYKLKRADLKINSRVLYYLQYPLLRANKKYELSFTVEFFFESPVVPRVLFSSNQFDNR